MSTLYRRWITELWAGKPIASEIVTPYFVGHWPDRHVQGPGELQQVVEQTRNMVSGLIFTVEIGPLRDGEFMAARWIGSGRSAEGPVSFTGNDILRLDADGQRFAEYWTGTSMA